METPQPVNLNLLKGILAKSKKIMNVVESTNPKGMTNTTQGFIDDNNDTDVPEYNNTNYTTEQIMASKLPQSIKEAMINKPIPKLNTMPQKFTLEDVSDLDDIKMIPNKRRINENKVANTNNSDLITINKNELESMVYKTAYKILMEDFKKGLTEETIKKTINTLINEGKLTVKKKI